MVWNGGPYLILGGGVGSGIGGVFPYSEPAGRGASSGKGKGEKEARRLYSGDLRRGGKRQPCLFCKKKRKTGLIQERSFFCGQRKGNETLGGGEEGRGIPEWRIVEGKQVKALPFSAKKRSLPGGGRRDASRRGKTHFCPRGGKETDLRPKGRKEAGRKNVPPTLLNQKGKNHPHPAKEREGTFTSARKRGGSPP